MFRSIALIRIVSSLSIASMLALSVVVGAGCRSTTTINTDPQGAQVYINGQLIGTTPVDHLPFLARSLERDRRVGLP